MKIVINKCYGGFSLSKEAYKFLGLEWDGYGYAYDRGDNTRHNEKLIACVEALGEKASGDCANLGVVEIPDNATDWRIDEYDGYESIIAVVNGKMIDIY